YMDSNAQEVTLALQGTLQQDPNIRKQAENRIWEYGKVSGFAPLLLRLACSDETAAEIRMAAAIALKNFIRKNWDNLKPWMEGYLEIMKMDCPSVSSSGGEPTFLDELKMEVCEIFTLYAQRFEEEISPFMQNIIQAVWQLVVQTGSETRFDGMVCSALEFLSIISQKPHYESYFVGEGVLQTIAQDVCVKNMQLRQEDLEMFEDEPIEYMKKDIVKLLSDETAAEIRMAAAIALKNFIRKNWGEAPEVDLSPEEEEEIRQSVLQGMFLIRGTLQGQLSHAVQLMAKIEGKL
ncbi:Importin-beta protein, partial [Ancylostoma duodenale]